MRFALQVFTDSLRDGQIEQVLGMGMAPEYCEPPCTYTTVQTAMGASAWKNQ